MADNIHNTDNVRFNMEHADFAEFVGSVSSELKNQSKILDKLEASVTCVKDDISVVKGDIRLMRSETDLKRKGCDAVFATHANKLLEFEERFSRDYQRLNTLESRNKVTVAVEKAQEKTIEKKRATTDYLIGIGMFLITIGSLVVAVIK